MIKNEFFLLNIKHSDHRHDLNLTNNHFYSFLNKHQLTALLAEMGRGLSAVYQNIMSMPSNSIQRGK
jgi:hypothetical protein